jgi:hypothetical protein
MVLWRKNARSRTPQNGGNMYGGNNVLTLKFLGSQKVLSEYFKREQNITKDNEKGKMEELILCFVGSCFCSF